MTRIGLGSPPVSILDIPPERFEPVKDASRLPISHVVAFEERLISVLTIDRLLPTVTRRRGGHRVGLSGYRVTGCR